MPDNSITMNVTIHGDVKAPLNVAGGDISIWAAAVERNITPERINPPVFVSYASDDREKYVLPLVERLQEAGYTVWFDQQSLEGGDDWKREIDQGIRKCVAFIAVLTPRSINSRRKWVRYEHEQALRLFVPIIPVILEECKLPKYFKHLQYLDMTTFDGVAFAKLQGAIEKALHRRGKWLVDQTPGVSRTFIGRQQELQTVYEMLQEGKDALAIAAVQGMGGIGKTMLAEELLRRLGPRYPGGVIVERRGPAPRDPQMVLRSWGRMTGCDPDHDLTSDEVRGMLQGAGELLVLFDDVWPEDEEAIKALLAALPRDADRIITTRNDALARDLGARVYSLHWLSEADGVALLRDRFAGRDPTPDDAVLRQLHGAVDGHALSLELAAGRFRNMPDLERQVDQLEERIKKGDISKIAANVPGLKKGRDNSLMVNLDETRRVLEKSAPELLDRFAMLGAFALDAPFDANAVMAVWNESDTEEAEEILAALAGYALLRTEGGCYSQHIVLRAYALELLKRDEGKVRAAIERHGGHFREIAAKLEEVGWSQIEPYEANIEHAIEQACNLLGDSSVTKLSEPEPPETPAEFDGQAARYTARMLTDANDYIQYRGPTTKKLRWLRADLAAARLRADDTWGEVRGLVSLSLWYSTEMGQLESALAYARKVLSRAEEIDDRVVQGFACSNIGRIYMIFHDDKMAQENFERALSLLADVKDDPDAQDFIDTILGELYMFLDQMGAAIEQFERSRPIYENRGGYARSLATRSFWVGLARLRHGEIQEGIEYLEKACSIMKEMGDQASILEGNIVLVVALCAFPSLNRLAEAIPLLDETITMMKQSGRSRIVADWTLDHLLSLSNSLHALETRFQSLEHALNDARKFHNREAEATALTEIGDLYSTVTQEMQTQVGVNERIGMALKHYEQALAIFREVGDPHQVARQLFKIANLLCKTPSLGGAEKTLPLLEETIKVMEQANINELDGKIRLGHLQKIAKDMKDPELQQPFGEQDLETTLIRMCELEDELRQIPIPRKTVLPSWREETRPAPPDKQRPVTDPWGIRGVPSRTQDATSEDKPLSKPVEDDAKNE